MSTSVLVLTAMLSAAPIVIVSGQSLAMGGSTSSALSTTQPYSNTMVSGLSVNSDNAPEPPTSAAWPFAALVESGSYESPRSAMANMYRSLSGVDVHVISGAQSGTAYSGLRIGTTPWGHMAKSIEAAGARTAAPCLALYVEHGEGDHNAGTSRATYTANLVEWQSTVATKCAASARGGSPPMYIAQFSSWTATALAGHSTTSVIPLAVYDAARSNAGVINLIGPHYGLTHAADGVHMTNAESRRMAAYAGKAIAAGPSWQPLWPRLDSPVSRAGAVVTVYLYTPTPPLVVDTTTVTGVSASTRGFEYTDDSSPPAISSVDCSAACSGNTCSCQITLSGTPTGANKKIRYAYTGVDTGAGGPTSGPRGNIRDSDTATWQGAALYNWLVHFEESVP